jgi:hypothetical protein
MGTNASTPENNRSDIMMTDVKPLLELVENPTLTEVYQLVVETPATVPEIREQIDISKTAAYDDLTTAGESRPSREGRAFRPQVRTEDRTGRE